MVSIQKVLDISINIIVIIISQGSNRKQIQNKWFKERDNHEGQFTEIWAGFRKPTESAGASRD